MGLSGKRAADSPGNIWLTFFPNMIFGDPPFGKRSGREWETKRSSDQYLERSKRFCASTLLVNSSAGSRSEIVALKADWKHAYEVKAGTQKSAATKERPHTKSTQGKSQ